jgi:hypothetical protein
MKAHLIDFNIILKPQSQAWVVDKTKPNIPLLKIDNSDLKIFQSGIYKNANNKIIFSGKTFWLPDSFMNKIKLKCKKTGSDISNLGISFQEFLNKELIENLPIELDLQIFNQIINTNDDIYIFCSKNTKANFSKQIEKFEEKLKDLGLLVKDYYFLNETFFAQDDQHIAFIKNKIIIQHLLGLKCSDNVLTDEKTTNYDQIFYYDDDLTSIELSKNINDVLEKLLLNSKEEVKNLAKEVIQNEDNILTIKYYTHNKANKFIDFQVDLKFSKVIKTFENFNLFSSSLLR